jgi:hypothetical protein
MAPNDMSFLQVQKENSAHAFRISTATATPAWGEGGPTALRPVNSSRRGVVIITFGDTSSKD